eukprot:13380975-Alexandrium_andersonii.AAC.1
MSRTGPGRRHPATRCRLAARAPARRSARNRPPPHRRSRRSMLALQSSTAMICRSTLRLLMRSFRPARASRRPR